MRNLADEFRTSEEAAEYMVEYEGEQFANDAGYETDNPVEIAELLEKGQYLHSTVGEWNYFFWKESE